MVSMGNAGNWEEGGKLGGRETPAAGAGAGPVPGDVAVAAPPGRDLLRRPRADLADAPVAGEPGQQQASILITDDGRQVGPNTPVRWAM